MRRFGPFTGRYVYHCHILEHEDHDMMRPFDVVKNSCKPLYCKDYSDYDEKSDDECNNLLDKEEYGDKKICWKEDILDDYDPKYDWKME